MGKSGHNVGKFGQSDGRTLAERVASFLQDQHPTKTALCVEAETGISADTVRKWLEQGNLPNGKAMLALIRRYRVSFLDAVCDDDWVAELARQEEQARVERQVTDLQRRLTELWGDR